jgi:large subunit ribosomal protein L7/L12
MSDLQKIVDDLSSLVVLESADLLHLIEEKWGVAATAALAATIAARQQDEVDIPEADEFTVILSSIMSRKIEVIKEIRALTGLGLKEAKDLVEAAPTVIGDSLSKVAAMRMVESLRSAGGDASYINRAAASAYRRSAAGKRASNIKRSVREAVPDKAPLRGVSADVLFASDEYRISSSVEADMMIEQLLGDERSSVEEAIASLPVSGRFHKAALVSLSGVPLSRFGSPADGVTQAYMSVANEHDFRILFSVRDNAIFVHGIFRASQLAFFRI